MKEDNGRFFYSIPRERSSGNPFVKAGYNPSQSRDDCGRWTCDDIGGDAEASPAAYRGHFHDFVVDDFLNGLRASGATY